MPKRKSNIKTNLKSLYQVINDLEDKGGRSLSEIFASLPDKNEYPDYYTIIKNPIALDIIYDKIENNSYSDLSGLYNDLILMLENAKTYNRKGSIIYKDAITLGQALEDAYSKETLTSPKKGKNDLKGIIDKLWDVSQSELFQELPDENMYPDYYQEIKNPIALSSIIEKISDGTINNIQEIESDLKLMVSNAKQYNAEGSEVITDAEFLMSIFYEITGTTPSKGVEILGVGAFKVDTFKVGREVYKVGDCVLIRNEIDPSKPIIGQIFDIWAHKSGGLAEGLTVCWYLLPEQTVHKASTKFMEKEVLKSNNFVNYSTKDVVGKCWILQVKDYCRGRPKDATFENTFVCESRYNDQAKHISKIKNWSSAVPESVRGVEPNLELFDTPLVPVKVLSSIAESLVKKEAEEVSEPEPELEDEEEDDEDASEQVERRGRPRRSTAVVNPIGSTPVAPEKKIVLSPGPVRPQAPALPPGPQLQVGPNPYLGVPAYSTPLPNTATSAISGGGFGRPNIAGQTPSGPTNQINPLYYNQLGNLPGDNIIESTAESFDRLPDGRIKWFAGPPLDVLDQEQPMHSVEYLSKRAQEPVQPTRKKVLPKTKEEPVADSQIVNIEGDVNWNRLTETLQELASIWLKDASSLVSS